MSSSSSSSSSMSSSSLSVVGSKLPPPVRQPLINELFKPKQTNDKGKEREQERVEKKTMASKADMPSVSPLPPSTALSPPPSSSPSPPAASAAPSAAAPAPSSSSSSSSPLVSLVRHNSPQSQFELSISGLLCYLNYEPLESPASLGVFNLWETFVPPELRGQDLALTLCDAAFEFCERHGILVFPSCSYIVKHYLPLRPLYYTICVDKHFKPLRPLRNNNSNNNADNAPPQVSAGHMPLPHHPVLEATWLKYSGLLLASPLRSPLAAADAGPFDGDLADEAAAALPASHLNRRLHELTKLYRTLSCAASDRANRLVGFDYFVRSCLDDDERAEFLCESVPAMIANLIALPDLFPHSELPILKATSTVSLTLSRIQIFALLICSFFSLLPVHQRNNTLVSANMDGWFNTVGRLAKGVRNSRRPGRDGQTEVEKLHCIVHYFHVLSGRDPAALQRGHVTFHRRCLAVTADALAGRLSASHDPLAPMDIRPSGTIEDDGPGTLQIDFANKYLGGGVLNTGCVQEEIRFSINPECLAGMFVCERMNDNEAIFIIGAERFANYTGYANSTRYAGPHEDRTPTDKLGRISTVIVAIDALEFYSSRKQFKAAALTREILKAYVGFSVESNIIQDKNANPENPYTFDTISTGNWGCGAFLGDIPTKSCLQLLAATLAGRSVRYFTFSDPKSAGIADCFSMLSRQRVTVSALWGAVLAFAHDVDRAAAYDHPPNLFKYLHTKFAAGVPASADAPLATAAAFADSDDSLSVSGGSGAVDADHSFIVDEGADEDEEDEEDSDDTKMQDD